MIELNSLSAKKAINQACDDFEYRLQRGEKPKIETYLHCAPTEAVSELLLELMKIELSYQVNDNDQVRRASGDNLRDFTVSSPLPFHCVDTGEGVNESADRLRNEYLERFPKHKAVVESAFDYEAASEDGESNDQRFPSIPKHLRRLGEYELAELISSGGTGTVYRAVSPDGQDVAIKVIHQHHLASRDAVARFCLEARTLEGIDHPGIVPILQMSEHDGVYFLVMPFIRGQELTSKFDLPLAPKEAARIIRDCAVGLHFMHGRGIIHRDVKPANILIDESDRVRIVDFGFARSLESRFKFTVTGEIIGTPAFMPPEQAIGDANKVAPSADVYSLGAVLYFLLTGKPPFDEPSAIKSMMKSVADEPVSPRRLNRSIPLPLQAICLNCLQKDPTRRYQSANRLSADLEHWLNGEPIAVRNKRLDQRIFEWCGKHPSQTMFGFVGMLLTIGLAISLFGASRWRLLHQKSELQNQIVAAHAETERQRRESAEQLAIRSRYHAHVREAQDAVSSKVPGWRSRFNRAIKSAFDVNPSGEELIELRSFVSESCGLIDLVEVKILASDFHGYCFTFSPSGTEVAIGQHRNPALCQVAIYNVATGERTRSLTCSTRDVDQANDGVRSLKYSPNGTQLVAGMERGSLHCWDTEDWQHRTMRPHSKSVRDILFVDEELFLTCANDGSVKLHSIANLDELAWAELQDVARSMCFIDARSSFLVAGDKGIYEFEYKSVNRNGSPTRESRERGTKLLAGVPRSRVGLPDSPRSRVGLPDAHGFTKPHTMSHSISFVEHRLVATDFVRSTHDQRLVLSAVHFGNTIRLSDADHDDAMIEDVLFRDPQAVSTSHMDDIIAVHTTDGDTLMASSSWDKTCKLWDTATGKLLLRIRREGAASVFPQFSPDATHLAIMSEEGVTIFQLDHTNARRVVGQQASQVRAARFDQNGSIVTLADNPAAGPSQLTRWKDVGTLSESVLLPDSPRFGNSTCFDLVVKPGRRAFVNRGHAMLQDNSGKLLRFTNVPEVHCSVVFSPNGEMVIAGLGYEIIGWNAKDGHERFRIRNRDHPSRRIHFTCVDAGNKTLVAGSLDKGVKIFTLSESEPPALRYSVEHRSTVHAILLDERSGVAFVGCSDGQLAAVDIDTGRHRWIVDSYSEQVTSLCRLQNDRLVTGAANGAIAIWQLNQTQPELILRIKLHKETPVTGLDARKDRLLIAQEGLNAAIEWDLQAIYREMKSLGLVESL